MNTSSSLVYKVAVSNTRADGLRPALILLHGRGTDEDDLIGLAPSFDPRLLVVSVRAPYEFAYGGYTWFDLDDGWNLNIDQLCRSRDALICCLDEIQKDHPVDPKKIFLYGFSMGAMMSLVLSLSHPDGFKAIVAHSGMLYEDQGMKYQWENLRNLSFFIAHGTYDPVVPVDLGRHSHQKLVRAGANVVYREYPILHTISDDSLHDTATWLQRLI